MKQKYFFILGSISLLFLVFISGCVQEDISESFKNCEIDRDCKVLHGNYAGCWNVNFVPPPLAPWELTISLAGPDKCVCHESKCTSVWGAAGQLYSSDKIEESFDACNKYERKSDIFNCYEMVICREITDKNKDLCYQKILDICPKITEYEHVKDSCYKKVANITLDRKWCDEISEGSEKSYCLSDIAFYTANVSLCYELSNVKYDRRDHCIERIAISTENVSMCYELEGYHGSCLSYVARSMGNLSLCYEIPKDTILSETNIENCITYVISPEKELSHCMELRDIDWGRCYGTVAVAKNDINICDQVPPNKWGGKDDCLYRFVKYNPDVSICHMIIDGSDKNYCYNYVAEKNKDPSVCNYLDHPRSRESCIEKAKS